MYVQRGFKVGINRPTAYESRGANAPPRSKSRGAIGMRLHRDAETQVTFTQIKGEFLSKAEWKALHRALTSLVCVEAAMSGPGSSDPVKTFTVFTKKLSSTKQFDAAHDQIIRTVTGMTDAWVQRDK